MVKSRVSVGGHPLHPASVAVPIGLLTGTVLADLAYLFVSQDQLWLGISFWTNVAGVATALLSSVSGFIDYFAIAKGGVRKIATAHMVLNLLMVGLYAGAALIFWPSHTAGNMTLPFALQFAGFALMMSAGFLGGEMVFKHKLGVVEEKDASKPNPKVEAMR